MPTELAETTPCPGQTQVDVSRVTVRPRLSFELYAAWVRDPQGEFAFIDETVGWD